MQPSWRFVLSRPAHLIAFLGGIGLIRFAPGTFGTLAAFPLHFGISSSLSTYAHLGLIAVLVVIGVWASGRTAHDLGVPDHGGIVFDETVAFLLVLFFTPAERLWQAFAFLLFRLFDIFKPPPIRHFDRTLHGGFGVMFDDLLAAGYTLLLLAVAKALVE
ncbi:MAG: phosphatidylglycerophosphatase A [Betaproteobacteria bacterium]|nr:MAG: phosphatidylglycerophosphatase A [Betaproteobacteria bacterium]